MKEIFTVTESESGQRIDRLCASKFPKVTRSQWQKGGVFITNNEQKKPNTKVKIGQEWTVEYAVPERHETLVPWDYPLQILHESATWAVVYKPAGISVHGSSSDHSQQTMVNALVYHFGNNLAENRDAIEGVYVLRPGLVHRLDKDTSGLLLIAKTTLTLAYFQGRWKTVQKFYHAKVSGRPPKKFVVEAGIMRDPNHRKCMTVSDTHPSHKPSRTSFERVYVTEQWSILRAELHTGRTHQIRVHLKNIGFPVVGDALYFGQGAQQMALYATQLIVPDPDNNHEKVVIKLPEELCPLLEIIANNNKP